MEKEKELEIEKINIEGTCFGEYKRYSYCETCKLREQCKRFSEAERNVSIRYKGKYSWRGKEVRKDKY